MLILTFEFVIEVIKDVFFDILSVEENVKLRYTLRAVTAIPPLSCSRHSTKAVQSDS